MTDELGYTADQVNDAATDYVIALEAGRPHEADVRAGIARQTFGEAEWLAAVDRASATSWVGMLHLVD